VCVCVCLCVCVCVCVCIGETAEYIYLYIHIWERQQLAERNRHVCVCVCVCVCVYIGETAMLLAERNGHVHTLLAIHELLHSRPGAAQRPLPPGRGAEASHLSSWASSRTWRDIPAGAAAMAPDLSGGYTECVLYKCVCYVSP